MDRIFQWVWDRYGPRYSWAICVLVYPPGLVVYLSYTLIIVAFEGSGRYIEAAAITAVAVLIRVFVFRSLPAGGWPVRAVAGRRVTRSIR